MKFSFLIIYIPASVSKVFYKENEELFFFEKERKKVKGRDKT